MIGAGTIAKAPTGSGSTADEILAAGERLVFGTLGLLGANANTNSPLLHGGKP